RREPAMAERDCRIQQTKGNTMNPTSLTRAFALAAAMGVMLMPARAEDPLVVIASGGVWLESAKANFVSCYKERTGEEPDVLTLPSGEVLNRLRANPDNPPIHVVMLSEIDAIRAGE